MCELRLFISELYCAIFKMSFLKLSIILCSFLILQAQALPQNQALNKASSNVNAIIDIITGVVKSVESEVDKTLENISERLDGFIANPGANLAQRISGLSSKILDRIVTVADERLNKLKEDGNADTQLIVGCIQNEEDNFRTLVNATFDQNSQCLVEELVTFHKSLRLIVGDLQTVQTDVKKALDKLDTCTGNTDIVLLCVLNVGREAFDVAKEIPEVTKEDVNDLIEIVKAFPQSFRTCVKSNVDDFRSKIVGLVDDISTCSRQ